MTRENLKNQVNSKIVNDELSEEEMMHDIMQMVDAHVTQQLILSGVVSTLPQDPIVLARYMHDAYEMLAKNNDWNTQENCKVDFSDLPIGNKNTMILLAGKLILDFGGN